MMSTASKDRRKSDKSSIITLTVPGNKLRAIFGDKMLVDSASGTATATLSGVKEEDSFSAKDSPAPSGSALIINDNASESMPNTPGGSFGPDGLLEGTPGPSAAMAPPAGADGTVTKKKGVKRSAAAAGVDANGDPGSANGDVATPKARSKPGPKKKQKMDDSLLDPVRGGAGGTHKLGPKASMGAINAGLRALDRSGKPCRKWSKGGFQLKTFTGVVWEIPRWTAPLRSTGDDSSADVSTTATASAEGSNKENANDSSSSAKENKAGTQHGINGKAANGMNGATDATDATDTTDTGSKADAADGDIEMQSVPSARPSPPPVAQATIAAVAVAVA
ncbi:duf1711 domain containing protein [Grosmannia clavigera kw1407]|uniref:Duf1711 domain containing protein n=1 Tax=Grosmannia clavigera (strain kw1407 / UAMH 11150) TaxID=655863 RepID=F0XEQ9_GROCL|nr:duf1711 domain containing protein [Grosmannia clavigera kw1407]EFX03669.1 duf1711 domain containing protein [Grosmannia clavigera kw1407]